MNKVFLIGRLTRDPTLKYVTSGEAVAEFSLAVDRPFKDSSGEKKADFINCVSWRKTAELVTQYLQKGSQVAVDGRIQSRSWDGQDGKRQYRTEVVVERVEFLSRPRQQEEESAAPEVSEEEDVPF